MANEMVPETGSAMPRWLPINDARVVATAAKSTAEPWNVGTEHPRVRTSLSAGRDVLPESMELLKFTAGKDSHSDCLIESNETGRPVRRPDR
jgi:hypothetical protein